MRIGSLDTNKSLDYYCSNWRMCSSKETYARIKPMIPVMGITRIANITGLDTIGIPVYTAHRPNSRSLSVTQGKGCTHDDAKTSALMEAVESYHAENIKLPLYLGDSIELSCRYKLIDAFKLQRFKRSEFTPNTRILWVEGDDLISNEKKLVPYDVVHIDYSTNQTLHSDIFVSSSNGLASGNSMQEANIHAICELIERDSLFLWYLKKTEEKENNRVDLDTIDYSTAVNLIDRFRKSRIHVGVWDITSDIGVPAFLCRLLPEDPSYITGIRPVSGMGCHLSKEVALYRALTEAAQSRLTFISGVRDDLNREDYKKFLSVEEYNKWHKIIVEETAQERDFRDIVSCDTGNTDYNIKALLNNLQKVGIEEVVSVNLTKPEFGISVARVIIPGLEGIVSGSETILGERAKQMLELRGKND